MLPRARPLEYLRYVYDPEMHKTMLCDSPRHRFFAACFANHRKAIEGNTVVDVGAGSGVLAALAVRYGGAGQVHAVEAMPEVARIIPDVLEAVLTPEEKKEKRIVVHNDLIQNICRNPPIGWPDRAAALVSEWFGAMAINEGLALPVDQCRDAFGNPPLMIPGRMLVWIQASVGPPEKGSRFECGSARIESRSLVGTPLLLLDVDLQHFTFRDLFGTGSHRLSLSSKYENVPVHGLVGWFDLVCCAEHQNTVLRTGPDAPETHWQQTWMPFDDPVRPPAEFDVRLSIAAEQNVLSGLPELAVEVERVLVDEPENSEDFINARFLLDCGRCLYNIDLDAQPSCKRHKASDFESCSSRSSTAEVEFAPSDVAEICNLAKRAVVEGPGW